MGSCSVAVRHGGEEGRGGGCIWPHLTAAIDALSVWDDESHLLMAVIAEQAAKQSSQLHIF